MCVYTLTRTLQPPPSHLLHGPGPAEEQAHDGAVQGLPAADVHQDAASVLPQRGEKSL